MPALAPGELLRQTLADPLSNAVDLHVENWLSVLVFRFPLLAFQARAFIRLNPTQTPSIYPLNRLVQSILRDDGIVQGNTLCPLLATIDRRRDAMAYAEYSLNSSYVHLQEYEPELQAGLPTFTEPYEPMVLERTRDGDVNFTSAYEEIGRELISHVEALETASAGRAYEQAKQAFNAFLAEIGVSAKGGNPGYEPNPWSLSELVSELRRLVELFDQVYPVAPSADTADELALYGVSSGADRDLWAMRLAFPVLSGIEAEVLLKRASETRQTSRFYRRKLTPLRFAIWLIARRLSMSAAGVYRKARKSPSDMSYYSTIHDPFEP